VVAAAFGRFLAGDTAGADSLLQAEPDEAVFERPPHTLTGQRVLYIAAIVGCLIAIAVALSGGW
jgi:hypothetical protein